MNVTNHHRYHVILRFAQNDMVGPDREKIIIDIVRATLAVAPVIPAVKNRILTNV